MTTVPETTLSAYPLLFRGKVRDIYDVGDQLLIVASDRLSAFDIVLPTMVPDKGIVLNQLSAFWFNQTASIVPNHLVSADPDLPESPPGRSMLVLRTNRIDIECVVRGYLAGSAWAEYRRSGTVCGIRLPSGLRESERLPEPIFTPATKAASGHDENIPVERMRGQIGAALTDQIIERSLAIFRFGAAHAEAHGLILADTKLEFGLRNGQLILIDELLTPDSSRFWPTEGYAPGRGQPSFDKQPVRDWLERRGWNKQVPAPELPPEIVRQTSARYREAFERLSGLPFRWAGP